MKCIHDIASSLGFMASSFHGFRRPFGHDFRAISASFWGHFGSILRRGGHLGDNFGIILSPGGPLGDHFGSLDGFGGIFGVTWASFLAAQGHLGVVSAPFWDVS